MSATVAGGSAGDPKTRFEAISAGLASEDFQDGVKIRFESGKWKIQREGVDRTFQVFSIKIPGSTPDAKIDYLEHLAQQFENTDVGNAALKAKLLSVAAQSARAFHAAQELIGSRSSKGTIKIKHTGKILASDFKATKIAAELGRVKKEAAEDNTAPQAVIIRECANRIFGAFGAALAVHGPFLATGDDEDDDPPESPDETPRASTGSRHGLHVHIPSEHTPLGAPSADDEDDDSTAASTVLSSPSPRDTGGMPGHGLASPLSGDEDPSTPPPSTRRVDPPQLDSGVRIEPLQGGTLDRIIEGVNRGPFIGAGHEFARLRPQLSEFIRDDTLVSVVPFFNGTSSDDRINFLVSLLGVRSTADAAAMVRVLNDQDMWYRLQLAILRTLHDQLYTPVRGGNTGDAEAMKALLSVKEGSRRMYPDFFYGAGSRTKHLLSRNGLIQTIGQNPRIQEIRAAGGYAALLSVRYPGDPTLSAFRAKLIENLGKRPEELCLVTA